MNSTVYFIGAADTTRQSVELLAGAMGCTVRSDVADLDFLSRVEANDASCVVYNAVGRRMEECLRWVNATMDSNAAIRIILICSECETSDVVRAMRLGVSAVLEIPFSYKDVEQAIENAIEESHRKLHESKNKLAPEVAAVLTRQEQEIAQMLLDGAGTKQISVKLDLSIRTIHYRKKAMISKLGSNAEGQSLRSLLCKDSADADERRLVGDRNRQSTMN